MRLLGKLPKTIELPRRKEARIERLETRSDIYANSIDDIIETTLQEIMVPLNRVLHTFINPEENPEGENQEIILEQIMGENRGQREIVPRWMYQVRFNL
jgi:hypothetical protein